MHILLEDQNEEDEIQSWEGKGESLEKWVYKTSIITSAIRGLAALTILFVILFLRKRRELFLILTPLFFLLSDIANIIGFYYVLTTNDSSYPTPNLAINILLASHIFFVLMGHQVFGAQYLRTSLILP